MHEKALKIYLALPDGAIDEAANHYGLSRWYFKNQLGNIRTNEQTLAKMVESMVWASGQMVKKVGLLDENVQKMSKGFLTKKTA